MKKDLNYYLNLRYKIELIPIPEEDGGGWRAEIPELGRYAFVGDGETVEEALRSLEETKKDYFEDWYKKGIEIPEPDSCWVYSEDVIVEENYFLGVKHGLESALNCIENKKERALKMLNSPDVVTVNRVTERISCCAELIREISGEILFKDNKEEG